MSKRTDENTSQAPNETGRLLPLLDVIDLKKQHNVKR